MMSSLPWEFSSKRSTLRCLQHEFGLAWVWAFFPLSRTETCQRKSKLVPATAPPETHSVMTTLFSSGFSSAHPTFPSSVTPLRSHATIQCALRYVTCGCCRRDYRDWSPSSVVPQALPTANTTDIASSRSNSKTTRGDQRDDGLSVRRRKDDAGSRGQG